MARRYGFEVELVQYSWPRWLFAQTEKQRIIWAYKILFFDVLFPLHLKKFIFVDADQVSSISAFVLASSPFAARVLYMNCTTLLHCAVHVL